MGAWRVEKGVDLVKWGGHIAVKIACFEVNSTQYLNPGMWSLGCKGCLSGLCQALSQRHLMGYGGDLRQHQLRTKETDAPGFSFRNM